MANIGQWVCDFANRRKGHIVTPDNKTYLIAVYPPDPPLVGSLDVDAASTLEEAISIANRVAGEQSNRHHWKPNSS